MCVTFGQRIMQEEDWSSIHGCLNARLTFRHMPCVSSQPDAAWECCILFSLMLS